jgi:UPF0716 protein FxsA
MLRLLAVALILLEIASLILIGRAVGVLLTLALVLLAAALGATILRRQGRDALARMQGTLRGGRDPRPVLLSGGFRFVAALLLILPGFLSDAVALLLLLPPVQRLLLVGAARRGLRVVQARGASARAPDPREPVIEAEWEELPPPKRPTHRPSGWTRH